MAAVTAIQLPNSRESESEADQIGIELAARAGFDPAAAVTLWEKMGKLGGGGPPEFLSTHPSPQNRSKRLAELGQKVQPLYLAAKGQKSEAPSFLNVKEAVNERVVTRPNEPTREEYAARVAREGQTMTFLSEPFDKFRRGETVLDCTVSCAFGYSRQKANWKRMHDSGNWRDLAVSVLQVGYLSDLSYFMLAEAARGLDLPQAAQTYYRHAINAGAKHGCGDSCEGFRVQQLAQAAIRK
jgi:hypothetical protein